jgi:beta-lactamase regulating signal transducer with metallopeptidase domain
MNSFLPFVENAFQWTWKTSAAVSVLVALVWLTQKLLGRFLSPRLRYLFSLLILVRLLVPVVPSSSLSFENLLPRHAPHVETASPFPASIRAQIALRPTPESVNITPATTVVPVTPKFSLRALLSLAWAGVVLCLCSAAVYRYQRWIRLIASGETIDDPPLLELLDRTRAEMGVQQPVRLVTLARLRTPAVFGLWRPCLLLPENLARQLSLEELRLIFLHEMAHIRRHDLVLNVLMIFLQFLHWFNPFVWLANRWHRVDRELVCDAMTLQLLPAEERTRYGQVLLKLVVGFSQETPVCAGMIPIVGSKEEIKRRLIMIKQQKRHGSLASLATALALGALGCVGFTRAQDVAQTKTSPSPAPGHIATNSGQIFIWGSSNGSTNSPLTIQQDTTLAQWEQENTPQNQSPKRPPPGPGIWLNTKIEPALPDSTEGILAAEGKQWVLALGTAVRVGDYVQDTLLGRLDQPDGRGMIAKVISMDEYIGMEHAWVDFGHGWLSHIRTSELSPIRFVTNNAAKTNDSTGAFHSIEWQLHSESKAWVKTDGPLRVGTYVQDTMPNRTNQPAGRGTIGKVLSLDEYNNMEHAWVDFGRGWTTHIPTAELVPLRITPGATPIQTPASQMNQFHLASPTTNHELTPQPTNEHLNSVQNFYN